MPNEVTLRLRPGSLTTRSEVEQVEGVRTIRRRTIRCGQFGADNLAQVNSARTIWRRQFSVDNSAQDNLARTIRRNNSSLDLTPKDKDLKYVLKESLRTRTRTRTTPRQIILIARINLSNVHW